MSTTEISRYDHGPCPCGKGRLIGERDYPDHSFASPSYSFLADDLACCRGAWRFDKRSGGWVNRQDEARAEAERKAVEHELGIRANEAQLVRIREEVVGAWEMILGRTTKAQEHQRLTGMGLAETQAQYLKRRESRDLRLREIASKNRDVLKEMARQVRRDQEVETVLNVIDAAKANYQARVGGILKPAVHPMADPEGTSID